MPRENLKQGLRILLVEDSPGDAHLAREALQSGPLEVEIEIATDGLSALQLLHHAAKRGPGALPHLVLLDLNLPVKSGFEVLESIRQDPALCHLPVVVFSSSRNEDDVQRAYRLFANCYLAKAETLEELMEKLHYLELFWGRIAVLPGSA